MFEAWNANLWRDATGLLLWMSHPAWHSTVWQTYDYDLDVNGAYYGSRKGCESLHVQADPSSWQVRAINHTAGELARCSVTARLYDLSGRSLGNTQQQTLDLPPSSMTVAFAVGEPAPAPALHLVRLELRDSTGVLRSENTYWRYRTPTDMHALNTLAHTQLALSAGPQRQVGERRTVTTTVGNRGATVAAMVRLSLRDGAGERVLPTRYDDNYFWLLPGETRQVDLSWPADLPVHQGIQVTVEAYNAPVRRATARP
jgi:hypothetical protein